MGSTCIWYQILIYTMKWVVYDWCGIISLLFSSLCFIYCYRLCFIYCYRLCFIYCYRLCFIYCYRLCFIYSYRLLNEWTDERSDKGSSALKLGNILNEISIYDFVHVPAHTAGLAGETYMWICVRVILHRLVPVCSDSNCLLQSSVSEHHWVSKKYFFETRKMIPIKLIIAAVAEAAAVIEWCVYIQFCLTMKIIMQLFGIH